MYRLLLCVSLLLPYHILTEFSNATVETFINMVLESLAACANYTLPVNNEKLMKILPSEEKETYDFGTFDFVIVGAGSAGTLLANRLTEVEKWNVLLLEAGGPENEFSDIPGMAGALFLTDMNWGYLGTPQKRACKAMNNNTCVCPRGKVVGGSSTINAKMYTRGNGADYDSWERMGNIGWSYKDVLPYFIKTENCQIHNANLRYRGRGGILDVNHAAPTVFTSIFLKGKKEVGYKLVDYNGKCQIGASQIQSTINGNKIASGGRAFIDPILSRKNLNLTINAFVTKLVVDRETKTALGVEFIKGEKKYRVKAKKEVILSAGTINTPQILMISGVGPKDELNRIGIETLVDLPVGKAMEDHAVFLGLNFRTNHTLFNDSMEVFLKGYLNNESPLTAAFSGDSVGFINVNDKKSSVPDIQQTLVVPPGVGNFQNKILNLKNEKQLVNPYSDIQIWLALLHPKSKGSVKLQSKNPSDFPSIDYNYYAVQEDIQTMHKAIKETLGLLETDAFKSINARYVPLLDICTQCPEGSEEYWQCLIEHLTTTMYHPVGTTRMGISRTNAVVSPKLSVHGVQRLRIVDAGVMPKIPSGNTNAPTYMIAEKAADYIKEQYLHLVLKS